MRRTVEEISAMAKAIGPEMTVTAKENAYGEWDTELCNGEQVTVYRSRKVKKPLTAVLKEYEISESNIKEYFSGAEAVVENDLIRATATTVDGKPEYSIYIKKQNQ